jgi:hypothetical protein
VDHSLARLIPDEERANFQAGDVEQWATKAIQDKLLLDLENIIATLAADTTKYASGYTNTLSGTSQWSDYVNSTPLKDIEVAKAAVRKSGNAPNVLIISDTVFQQLINHPRSSIASSTPGPAISAWRSLPVSSASRKWFSARRSQST